MIPAPEPNFGLKGKPFTFQDIPADGNSAPAKAARVSHPRHKGFVGSESKESMFLTEISPGRVGLQSISEPGDLIVPGFHFVFLILLKKHLFRNGEEIPLEKREELLEVPLEKE